MRIPESASQFPLYSKLLAVAVGVAALGAAPAYATTHEEAPVQAVTTSGLYTEECPWKLFRGGENVTNCQPPDQVLATCVTAATRREARYITYDSNDRQLGASFARLNIQPPPSGETRTEPQIEMLEDNAATTSGKWADVTDYLGRVAHYTMMRHRLSPEMVMSDDPADKLQLRQLKLAIKKETNNCGYNEWLTLDGNYRDSTHHWPTEPEAYTRKFIYSYVKKAAKMFKGKVNYFELFNEPNYDPLEQMQGFSQEETQKVLFLASERTIEHVIPDANVVFGAENAVPSPAVKLGAVIDTPVPPVVAKYAYGPFRTAYVALHAYQKFQTNLNVIPDLHQHVPVDSKEINFSSLSTFEDFAHQEFLDGKIQTRDGGEPKVANTEFGLWEASLGKYRDRSMTAWSRSFLYPAVDSTAIQDSRLAIESQYMMIRPDLEGAGGDRGTGPTWNTGLITYNVLSPSYFAIKYTNDALSASIGRPSSESASGVPQMETDHSTDVVSSVGSQPVRIVPERSK